MALTFTDQNGRQYVFTDTEARVFISLLEQNTLLRQQLLTVMIEADNKRLKDVVDVIAGRHPGPVPCPYSKAAHVELVNSEYQRVMTKLLEILSETGEPVFNFQQTAPQPAAYAIPTRRIR